MSSQIDTRPAQGAPGRLRSWLRIDTLAVGLGMAWCVVVLVLTVISFGSQHKARRDADRKRGHAVSRRIHPSAWLILGYTLQLALVSAALVLTRILSTRIWRLPIGDVGLYHEYAVRFWTQHPLLHALPVEYPPLAIVPFSLTLLPASRDYTAPYAYWMGVLVIVGYLGFLRYSTHRRALVYALYLLVGATATLLARFDLVPALLTLAALWATQRRRFGAAYLLIAAGTLIKLYPIFLLPVVLIADARAATLGADASGTDATAEALDSMGQRRWQGGLRALVRRLWARPATRRIARGAALCLGVVALGFACALALSPGDALSSFFYARVRPLQVESTPASLLWLGTLVGVPAGPDYSFSSLNYVGALDGVLKPLSAVALVVACGLVYYRQARGRLGVGQAFVACLCAVLVTNKIFSPQYLIWVLPVVAAVEGLDLAWLAICILTTIVYPNLYLTRPTFATVTYTPAFMPVLAARNLLLLALTVRAVLRRPRSAYAPSAASSGVALSRHPAASATATLTDDAALLVRRSRRSGRRRG